tara:strand:- start:113 stop:607 length:495 start_codon:yes stop_codon:yes gene_type:complete
MNSLNISNLNAKELYSLFSTLYYDKHGKEYRGVGFVGNEMHKLKEALDVHGSSAMACAMLNCINNNDRTVNVPYFAAGVRYYLVPHPDVYWNVKKYGTPDIKKLYRAFMFLDAVWLPSASQKNKRKELLNKLREWANAKTGKTDEGQADTKIKGKGKEPIPGDG